MNMVFIFPTIYDVVTEIKSLFTFTVAAGVAQVKIKYAIITTVVHTRKKSGSDPGHRIYNRQA
jgi:hypothetical protein